MNTPIILAEVYAGILIIIGLSVLNKKYMAVVFTEIAKSKALIWITGFVTVLIGIVSLAFYNTWSSNWYVIVTIAGWTALLKGIFMTLFPKTLVSLYRNAAHNNILFLGGIISIICGCLLFYCALVLR